MANSHMCFPLVLLYSRPLFEFADVMQQGPEHEILEFMFHAGIPCHESPKRNSPFLSLSQMQTTRIVNRTLERKRCRNVSIRWL